jgi:SAM-dependent methyltransferase
MSTLNNCRICRAPLGSTPELRLPNTPRGTQYFLTEDQLAHDFGLTIDLFSCRFCGHVQLAGEPVLYSNDCTSATGLSPAIQEHRNQQAKMLVERFQLRDRAVLDAGCGDGYFLKMLQSAGANPTGLEPSGKARATGDLPGLRIIDGMVSRDQLIAGAPYDAFVTFHVLEHVPDPLDFLQGLQRSLIDDGIGLVEVPSLERILERKGFFDFMPDHLSYFSLSTLRLTLELSGFDVLDAYRDWNGEHAVAVVRKRKNVSLRGLQSSMTALVNVLNEYAVSHVEAGHRVAVWGASHHALPLLAKLDCSKLEYVIDSAPYKQMRFTPLSHLRVVPPTILAEDPVDAVIIIAPRYQAEILAQLRVEIGFLGTIAMISDDSLVVVQEASECPV